MAFYKDMKHKTRQEKRVEAAARGGFEDEGAGYRKGGAQKGTRRPLRAGARRRAGAGRTRAGAAAGPGPRRCGQASPRRTGAACGIPAKRGAPFSRGRLAGAGT